MELKFFNYAVLFTFQFPLKPLSNVPSPLMVMEVHPTSKHITSTCIVTVTTLTMRHSDLKIILGTYLSFSFMWIG